MADQKISDLTPTTPADADNLPIERGAAANFKVSFNALRTWLEGFFATDADLSGHVGDSTIHFAESSIDHVNIQNVGANTHAQIDTHIGDGTVHFTEASIDHTNIANVGTNTHAQIDAHIADGTIHYADAPADGQDYARNNNAWVVVSAGGIPDILVQQGDLVTYSGSDYIRLPRGPANSFLGVDATGTFLEYSTPTGAGDVSGPASAVDDNFALYDGASGKIIKDGGVNASSFDAAGTAAGLVSAHEAAPDPHSQYQTEAESDARYGQLAAVNAWTENQQYNGVGLISAQAGRFSLTYAPDGIYDPLDGGFEAAEGASILLGTVTEVASLKHATGESQQVYVTENGELFGVDPPEPAWSISATDSTDTTAGSGGGQSAWVEMGFTPALVLPQDVTPSDEIQVDTRIYWANLAGNASGTVSIGFGIDGADPVAPGATEQLGNGFAGPIPTSWTVTGLTLTTGQTLSLFMRRESGSSGQFNPVAQGTTQAHNVTIRDRREGGAGGDGDVTGPGSATNDNFAAFDGVSGKVIKDAGVSASDFAAAGSPYALEVPHTWTISSGTVDNTLDVLEWVVPAPAGQTATIKRLSYKIKTGSINLTLQQNGAPVAGYTGLAVGATRSTTAGDVALSDLDELDIVIDSGSGTGLTVTVMVEYAGTL